MLLKSSCRSSRRDWPTVLVVSLGSPVGAGAKRKPSLALGASTSRAPFCSARRSFQPLFLLALKENLPCVRIFAVLTQRPAFKGLLQRREEKGQLILYCHLSIEANGLFMAVSAERSSLSAFPVASLGVYACEKIAFRLGDDVQDMPS